MEKGKFIVFLAGLLGICAIVLPAGIGPYYDSYDCIWWAGFYLAMYQGSIYEFIFLFLDEPAFLLMLIPLILVASGAITSLLTLNSKVHILAIVPGILMLTGCASWFLLFYEGEPMFLLVATIPFGVLFGIIGGLVSIGQGIPRMGYTTTRSPGGQAKNPGDLASLFGGKQPGTQFAAAQTTNPDDLSSLFGRKRSFT